MLQEDFLHYQNLIYYIANNFKNYPYKEDLYQVGYIGLINAYHNYKDDKNTKFSTYAYSYILGEMKKLVREDKPLKISREITKLNLKIEKANILLTQKLGRVPSVVEVANYLEIPFELVSMAINSNNPVMSMDQSYTQDKETSLYEVVEGRSEDIDTKILINGVLETLTPLERNLIHKRYMEDLTQKEVATMLGMSQVQVSRNETKVLSKLKTKLKN